jgi:hypothetical protein
MLSRGTELTFDQDAEGAVCDVKFDIPTPEFPEYEDSKIVQWHASNRAGGCAYGFAERGCKRGCRIYCREDDVLTEGVLKVGSEISHAIEQQNDGRVKAVKISIYKIEETQQ